MKTYPIAEMFVAPQGEGTHSGTLMAFIRFAGCTVGKPFTQVERDDANSNLSRPALQVYQEKCTAYDGTEFACDTNYKMSEKKTVDEILAFIGDIEHVCLTGGEPLMHDLTDLIDYLDINQKRIHIETSGTLWPSFMSNGAIHSGVWITVAPKHGYLVEAIERADEIKLLVDENTMKLDLESFSDYMDKVYLMSINYEDELSQENIGRCLELQQSYPEARIGIQLHKVIGTR